MSTKYHRLVKQALDGEIDLAGLPPELRAEVEAAQRLFAVDREPVTLSAALADRVMAEVRRRARSPGVRAWRWLTAPSVPPWGAVAFATAAVLVMLIIRSATVGGPGTTSPLAAAAGPESVYVRFVLFAPGAQRVALAGTFNGWNPATTPLSRASAGAWTVTVPIPTGQHQYAFIVDGHRWVADPVAPSVDDGFGRRNSVMTVSRAGGRIL
jgi:Glycogen recognition site of AMP-activated protein kinase